MTNLLFVYGTLLQRGNPFAIILKKIALTLIAGKIKGCLYDIGEYPGLLSYRIIIISMAAFTAASLRRKPKGN
jgi:gamma-glutamylcyclotransferase (GGCT)/AIG2-like uncharacterized protein YtfP